MDDSSIELKINTEIGILHAIFVGLPINCYQDIYTAWFKERPTIIVQADTINEAVEELLISLNLVLKYEQREVSNI